MIDTTIPCEVADLIDARIPADRSAASDVTPS
jgi:hypothetical protein